MKVDVTLKELTNAQVAAVLLMLPAAKPNDYSPVRWRVNSWTSNLASLDVINIEDTILQGIFFELKERTVVITSSRNGREGY